MILKTLSSAVFLILLFFGALVYADTNGIWNRAEDFRGGVFANDEQAPNNFFTFENRVELNNVTYIATDVAVNKDTANYELDVNGTIKAKRILADNFRGKGCPKALALVGVEPNGDLICEKMETK